MSMSVMTGFRIPDDTNLFDFQKEAREAVLPVVLETAVRDEFEELLRYHDVLKNLPAGHRKPFLQAYGIEWKKDSIDTDTLRWLLGRQKSTKEGGIESLRVSIGLQRPQTPDGFLYGGIAGSYNVTQSIHEMEIVREYRYENSTDSLVAEIGEEEFESRGDKWREVLHSHWTNMNVESIKLGLVNGMDLEINKEQAWEDSPPVMPDLDYRSNAASGSLLALFFEPDEIKIDNIFSLSRVAREKVENLLSADIRIDDVLNAEYDLT